MLASEQDAESAAVDSPGFAEGSTAGQVAEADADDAAEETDALVEDAAEAAGEEDAAGTSNGNLSQSGAASSERPGTDASQTAAPAEASGAELGTEPALAAAPSGASLEGSTSVAPRPRRPTRPNSAQVAALIEGYHDDFEGEGAAAPARENSGASARAVHTRCLRP
jgi:hypothetical protein